MFYFTGCNSIYTTSSGSIHSPLYPNYFPNNTACTFNISAEQGNMIYVAVRSIFLIPDDTLKVFERDSNNGRLALRKSFWTLDAYYSLSNSLLIMFKSDSRITTDGFKIDFLVTKGTVNGVTHGVHF